MTDPLIEASSLGSVGARQLRARTPQHVREELRRRAQKDVECRERRSVGAMANPAHCPRCGELIEREHNGKGQGVDERTDPWVFTAHDRDDDRGGRVIRTRCPGSGRNLWTAANAY